MKNLFVNLLYFFNLRKQDGPPGKEAPQSSDGSLFHIHPGAMYPGGCPTPYPCWSPPWQVSQRMTIGYHGAKF